MGSTRLPNKVLNDIVGRPMLWHIINRIQRSELIGDIIIATTLDIKDDEIEIFAKKNNIKIFRGSEEDVLDRYYQSAKKYKVNSIVRVTADDALKDPVVIDKVIKKYLKNKLDYASNTIKPTYPLGLDIEVFSFDALEKAWGESNKQFEREHVTPYIWTNPTKFNIENVTYEEGNLSHLRWTIDTKEDFIFVKTIYENLYKEGEIFLMNDILKLLEKHPEFIKINKNIKPKNIFDKD